MTSILDSVIVEKVKRLTPDAPSFSQIPHPMSVNSAGFTFQIGPESHQISLHPFTVTCNKPPGSLAPIHCLSVSALSTLLSIINTTIRRVPLRRK